MDWADVSAMASRRLRGELVAAGDERLLTIGEFARRAQLSVKALRLYERLGVLVPADVDPSSGYRRYRAAQLATARLVAMLRRLDMPLAEVARVVDADGGAGAALVRAHWDAVERRVAAQRELAEHLRTRLSGGTYRPAMFDAVRTRDVPAQAVLSERRHASIGQLAQWLGPTMGRLATTAAAQGGLVGPVFVIYHGEVNHDSDGPVEVCAPVGAGGRWLPAHREAYLRIRKAQVEYPQILSAFDAVELWLDEHGYAASGPSREVYFTDFQHAAAEDEVCDVAIPFAPQASRNASRVSH